MGGVCDNECVKHMDELACETGKSACGMEVLACPNGDPFGTGDSLAPPTAHTLASNARRSDSDMPIAVVNAARVSPLPSSSVERGHLHSQQRLKSLTRRSAYRGYMERKSR